MSLNRKNNKDLTEKLLLYSKSHRSYLKGDILKSIAEKNALIKMSNIMNIYTKLIEKIKADNSAPAGIEVVIENDLIDMDLIHTLIEERMSVDRDIFIILATLSSGILEETAAEVKRLGNDVAQK